MSRRDTIIIAVLLNAGLLIVLFATNLKSGKDDAASEVAIAAPKIEEPVAAAPLAAPVGDPIDQMLKSYTPPTPAPAGSAPNFAADLQAIGAPAAATPEPIAMPAPAMQPDETSYKEHKVKKGEVLERIARQHHVSVDDIMKFNSLSTTRLKIGQTLKIPSKSAPKSIAQAQPQPASDGAVKYYTVKNGDNPWTIAVKNHMKVEELLKLNNLDEDKARRLKPGDQIRIK